MLSIFLTDALTVDAFLVRYPSHPRYRPEKAATETSRSRAAIRRRRELLLVRVPPCDAPRDRCELLRAAPCPCHELLRAAPCPCHELLHAASCRRRELLVLLLPVRAPPHAAPHRRRGRHGRVACAARRRGGGGHWSRSCVGSCCAPASGWR
jgi:hypothetical protein